MTVARCEAGGRKDGQSLRVRELFPAKWAPVRRSKRIKCKARYSGSDSNESGDCSSGKIRKLLERENASTSHRLYEPLPAEFK
jgi:hypothetical protein